MKINMNIDWQKQIAEVDAEGTRAVNMLTEELQVIVIYFSLTLVNVNVTFFRVMLAFF